MIAEMSTPSARIPVHESAAGDRAVWFVVQLNSRVFRRVAGHQEGLAWWNFAFLFTITAMPFTSSLLGIYGSDPLAVDIFAVSVLLAALAMQATLLFGQRQKVLIAPGGAEIRVTRARVRSRALPRAPAAELAAAGDAPPGPKAEGGEQQAA